MISLIETHLKKSYAKGENPVSVCKPIENENIMRSLKTIFLFRKAKACLKLHKMQTKMIEKELDMFIQTLKV